MPGTVSQERQNSASTGDLEVSSEGQLCKRVCTGRTTPNQDAAGICGAVHTMSVSVVADNLSLGSSEVRSTGVVRQIAFA